MLELISTYNTAQNDLIEKYNKQSKHFQRALYLLFVALIFLSTFIFATIRAVIQ